MCLGVDGEGRTNRVMRGLHEIRRTDGFLIVLHNRVEKTLCIIQTPQTGTCHDGIRVTDTRLTQYFQGGDERTLHNVTHTASLVGCHIITEGRILCLDPRSLIITYRFFYPLLRERRLDRNLFCCLYVYALLFHIKLHI